MGNRKLPAKLGLLSKPGLNHVGLRDPDLFETRLQFAIIQERNLHRAFGGQLAAQERLHTLLDLRVFRASTIPMHALSRSLRDRCLHPIERRVRRGAPGREQRDRGQDQTRSDAPGAAQADLAAAQDTRGDREDGFFGIWS